MPLSVMLAILAIVIAVVLTVSRGGQRSGGRFTLTAVGLWVGMLVLAIALWAVGTLLVGR